MGKGLLLDTCAVIWMSRHEDVSKEAMNAINYAEQDGTKVLVSPVTAWEMGMLLARRRITETKTAQEWYRGFMETAGFDEAPVTADIFMASCELPHLSHKDPIDRILIATAREHDLTIITRDQAILAYGAAGHVRVLAC
ncbi:type II toxin-antitoxin system VapC family toxin [Rhizobium sp. TRM95796]|uniref:type II toxin-antitoxin system VapC family toxin n=1 Tax=Rhizobium sp. TRM95796 TaxID=2979862 RepID=UPI0021E7B495|nr:type II toxin-antitoxin system VapC family toxin [Rhizobium sp. TRM95796]MCV3764658.1 type II toxin-antitoxin system VapC family toxin [Rhizobium sp. TRM95796]